MYTEKGTSRVTRQKIELLTKTCRISGTFPRKREAKSVGATRIVDQICEYPSGFTTAGDCGREPVRRAGKVDRKSIPVHREARELVRCVIEDEGPGRGYKWRPRSSEIDGPLGERIRVSDRSADYHHKQRQHNPE